MKAKVLILLFVALGCKKDKTPTPLEPIPHGWSTYTIPAGNNYCLESKVLEIKSNLIQFQVTFDSTAVYQTTHAENQADWNKVIGYSDCGSFHQQNSLRLGWRYTPNVGIELAGYSYVNGTRIAPILDTIQVHDTITVSMAKVLQEYQINVNGKLFSQNRGCDSGAQAYWLYPYFGGNETSPQEMKIHLRFINISAPR